MGPIGVKKKESIRPIWLPIHYSGQKPIILSGPLQRRPLSRQLGPQAIYHLKKEISYPLIYGVFCIDPLPVLKSP